MASVAAWGRPVQLSYRCVFFFFSDFFFGSLFTNSDLGVVRMRRARDWKRSKSGEPFADGEGWGILI